MVSFDVPAPPSYGGVIDVYHAIKNLEKFGVKVHLHAFEYGRGDTAELRTLASRVSVYPRRRLLGYHLSSRPFLVKSRMPQRLLTSLTEDDHPILFLGLHTTGFLTHPSLQNRRKIVRTHNVEHDYYRGLARAESNPVRKLVFRLEAWKLERYEKVLKAASRIVAISPTDAEHFSDLHDKVDLIPAFHGNDHLEVPEGVGEYACYHGNLSVVENHAAAMWLVEHVAGRIDLPLVIAGRSPRLRLIHAAANSGGSVELIANPDENEMRELIRKAQIHLMPTFQATGLKLKLLEALYHGRWVVVTPEMVAHTGLEDVCNIAAGADEMVEIVSGLKNSAVPEAELARRKQVLKRQFDPVKNAQSLADICFAD
jgi:glycosyltransferase involved in cell wall biosynthesis